MKDFKNKTAAITGAGSGIGRQLAVQLGQAGCKVAISDINEEALAETGRLLEQNGTRYMSTILDVADKKAMEKWPQQIEKELGGNNIIINNAGVTVVAPFEEHSLEDFEWLMGINFWGVIYGTRFFMPYLQKASEGYIVNISSIFGLFSSPYQSSYNASKFAVRGFTESLRQEMKDSHIGVSCVHPGGIKTNIARNSRFNSLMGNTDSSAFHKRFDQITYTTAAGAAKTIIDGMRSKKRRILIGPDAHFLDVMTRLAPTGYDTAIDGMYRLLT